MNAEESIVGKFFFYYCNSYRAYLSACASIRPPTPPGLATRIDVIFKCAFLLRKHLMVQLGVGACSLRCGCLRDGSYLELLNEDFSACENKVTNFKAGSAGCATTVRNKNKP